MEFARLGAPLVRQLDDVGRACVAEVEAPAPATGAAATRRAASCAPAAAPGPDAHLACLARVASRESEANGSYPRWDRCAVCGDAAEPAALAVSLLYGDDDDGAAERRDAAEAKALVEAALVAVRRAHGEGHALGYDPPPETPVNTPVPWVPPR
ncbi:hypothetical protein JL720_15959 [Aureococcus anophagefferens]|nr:hypothetical protein JL720_15959 [Aureococcus anophagefferens]